MPHHAAHVQHGPYSWQATMWRHAHVSVHAGGRGIPPREKQHAVIVSCRSRELRLAPGDGMHAIVMRPQPTRPHPTIPLQFHCTHLHEGMAGTRPVLACQASADDPQI